MKNENTNLENIDFIKVNLMLLIILYHSMIFFTGNWFNQNPVFSSKFYCILSRWLNTFHIYTFTLVSGYLYAYLKYEKGKYNNFLNFFKNKFRRLIIPYVFVSLFWAIPFYICFFHPSLKDIAINYFLGVAPNQLWFLLMLFIVFILAYFLSDLWVNNFVIGGVSVIVLYLIGLLGSKIFLNIFQLFIAFKYILFFWMGFIIYNRKVNFIKKIPLIVYMLIDLILFIILLNTSISDTIICKLISSCCNILLNIIGSLGAFLFLDKLSSYISYKNNNIFCMLKKYMFQIYLLHQQIIYCFINILNGYVRPSILVFICFSLSLLFSIILVKIFEKNKFTRFIVGI